MTYHGKPRKVYTWSYNPSPYRDDYVYYDPQNETTQRNIPCVSVVGPDGYHFFANYASPVVHEVCNGYSSFYHYDIRVTPTQNNMKSNLRCYPLSHGGDWHIWPNLEQPFHISNAHGYANDYLQYACHNMEQKATEADAYRAGIPAGYSIRNWSPTEPPIVLLGSVFDSHSLGKWIHDWTVFQHGVSSPMADVARDLWLLLTKLVGKMKRPQEYAGSVHSLGNQETVRILSRVAPDYGTSSSSF